MQQSASIKAYRNIVLLLLLALFMMVRMVDYGERVFVCTPGACTPPASTLFIFSHSDFPEGGLRRALGFFAGEGIPVWLGWAGGLIVPVVLLVLAYRMLPPPPWKR